MYVDIAADLRKPFSMYAYLYVAVLRLDPKVSSQQPMCLPIVFYIVVRHSEKLSKLARAINGFFFYTHTHSFFIHSALLFKANA